MRRSWRGAVVVALLVVACGGNATDDAAPAGGDPRPPSRGEAVVPEVIDDVVIHAVVDDTFTCTEHAAGGITGLGDALGSDCVVVRYDSGPTEHFASTYEGDGGAN